MAQNAQSEGLIDLSAADPSQYQGWPIPHDVVSCGRGNTSFRVSAHASVNLYALLQTSRVNGIDGFRYLMATFNALPISNAAEDYAVLLPWRIGSLIA